MTVCPVMAVTDAVGSGPPLVGGRMLAPLARAAPHIEKADLMLGELAHRREIRKGALDRLAGEIRRAEG